MRPIDADALIEVLNDNGVSYNADVNYFIIIAPTIDTVSVVHGEWTKNADGNYECSECHVAIRGEDKPIYPFCAWCGAKMDGEYKESK